MATVESYSHLTTATVPEQAWDQVWFVLQSWKGYLQSFPGHMTTRISAHPLSNKDVRVYVWTVWRYPEHPEHYIKDLKRVWRREQVSQRIYQTLAARETDPNKRTVLQRLAEMERTHGERWVRQLLQLGEPAPVYHDTLVDAMWRWVLVKVARKML